MQCFEFELDVIQKTQLFREIKIHFLNMQLIQIYGKNINLYSNILSSFSVDLDSSEFSAGQAGSLLAALVQRRNAMAAVAAQGQASQGGFGLMSQVNGNMGSMMRPSNMVGQQRAMGPMSPMEMMRAQMPRNISDMSSGGMMGYSATTTRNGQTSGKNTVDTSQKSGYPQVMNDNMGGREMMSASWPHQGVMPRPLREGEMKSTPSSGAMSHMSQMESATPPGMYTGMRPPTGPSSGRGTASGYPYYQ